MKVKELINILSQVDPEKEVIIKYTDHTDYTYTFDFDDEDVFINTEGSPYGDDDFENDEWNEDKQVVSFEIRY